MRGKGTLSGVICKNDYPKEINQLHRMLSPAIEAVKGTVYDYPVTKVVLGKLVINNVVYEYLDVMKIPSEMDISRCCRLASAFFQSYIWFGMLHCFSNFHPSPIEIAGKIYMMVEQYIQSEKAKLFKDGNAVEAIMHCYSPVQMKEIGRNIKGYKAELWNAKAPEVAYNACSVKFREYPSIRKTLLDTHPYQLAEASKERPWGCGYTLKDDGASDPKNWTSKGIMGRVLEKIREELIMEFGVPSSRQSGATSVPDTVPKQVSGSTENDALAQSILSSGGADEEMESTEPQ